LQAHFGVGRPGLELSLIHDVVRVRDSKSEDGIRSIAVTAKLAEALWQHRRNSS
jgi:hypothetical protein